MGTLRKLAIAATAWNVIGAIVVHYADKRNPYAPTTEPEMWVRIAGNIICVQAWPLYGAFFYLDYQHEKLHGFRTNEAVWHPWQREEVSWSE